MMKTLEDYKKDSNYQTVSVDDLPGMLDGMVSELTDKPIVIHDTKPLAVLVSLKHFKNIQDSIESYRKG